MTPVSTGCFCEHYCLEQLVLYHFSDCDSLKNKQGFFKCYVMANYYSCGQVCTSLQRWNKVLLKLNNLELSLFDGLIVRWGYFNDCNWGIDYFLEMGGSLKDGGMKTSSAFYGKIQNLSPCFYADSLFLFVLETHKYYRLVS